MRLAVITSHRSVSLQRVAQDIIDVLSEEGVLTTKYVTYPVVDPMMFKDVDAALVVMTFDTFWATPYFLLCRNLNQIGIPCIFYTTIEGYPIRHHGDEWIYRDLEFVANSNYTASRLRSSGAKIRRVIYHGVFVDKIQSLGFMRRRMRWALGLKDDVFVVLYVAGAYMRKGHGLFAECCRILQEKDRSIKVVILTQPDATPNYAGCDNVLLLKDFGELGEDDIYGLYHASDLYVQASLSEGFGLPVLEALAAGKPVVHADYDPLSEITDTKTSFRVKVKSVIKKRDIGGILYELHYYDPKEFAEMILYAKDEILRNRDEYSSRCLERAKMFEARKIYTRFIELLSDGWTHVGSK